MILMDYSAVAIMWVTAQLRDAPEITTKMVRPLIIESIRSTRMKHKARFGELVICCDGGESWRKTIFPYYKASRKKIKDASGIDWIGINKSIDEMITEIKNHFPYKCVQIDNAEGDDVIATLARELPGEHVIVSNDKDFLQLQALANVQQFSPLKGAFLNCYDPEAFLKEFVWGGDSGDGIPNVLSDRDTFINPEKRQKPMTAKRIQMLHEGAYANDEAVLSNIEMNRQLMSLFEIPDDVRNSILDEYNAIEVNKRNKLLPYFMDKRLSSFMPMINEF